MVNVMLRMRFGENLNRYSCKSLFEKHSEIKESHIKYLEKLSEEDFEKNLTDFLHKFKNFKKIASLDECDFAGWYLMVLKSYKQVYIGRAYNIKKRIRQHWRENKRYDGQMPLHIDFFGILDTSSIFVIEEPNFINNINILRKLMKDSGYPDEYLPKLTDSSSLEGYEMKMIKYFDRRLDNRFLCNRHRE